MPNTELPELPRARRGPQPLPAADRRTHCVSVRLSTAELDALDAARAPVQMQRGEYLRAASHGTLPPSVPELNRRAWSALARSAANLNQIAHRINAADTGADAVPLDEVREAVQALRRALIGAAGAGDESES